MVLMNTEVAINVLNCALNEALYLFLRSSGPLYYIFWGDRNRADMLQMIHYK